MKDFLKIMNMTCGNSILKIFILFIVLFVSESIWLYLQMQNAELIYMNEMGMDVVIMVIGFIILLWIQIKRFRQFAQSGSFTRIQLLPISKRFFLFSEVMFQYCSVLLMTSIPFIIWFLLVLTRPFHFPFLNNVYVYATLLTSLTKWMPINIFECIYLLIILLGVAYAMTAFSFTTIDTERRISLIFLLVIATISLLFLNTVLFTSSIMRQHAYEIFCLESILLIILLHWQMEYTLLIRRKHA